MRFKLNYKMTFEQADKLIEKYYDGLSTVEEEKLLRKFLSQPKLPAKYKPEQDIFGYFELKKQKTTFKIQPYIRWVSTVAAVLVLAFGIQIFILQSSGNYAYIDGVKITNNDEIRTRALASLSNVSADNNEIEQSFKNLNGSDLMQKQLDVFSELGD